MISGAIPYLILSLCYFSIALIERFLLSNSWHFVLRNLCGLIFILFFGYSGLIGSDWHNYKIFYDNVSFETSDFEFGFTAIALFLKEAGLGFSGFKSFIIILFVVLLNNLLRKFESPSGIVYFLILFVAPVLFIDAWRNSLSMLLAMQAIPRSDKRVSLASLLWLFLSVSFHVTGILFVIPLIFLNEWFRTRIYISILLLGVLFAVFSLDLYLFDLISLAVSEVGNVDSYLINRYLDYFKDVDTYGLKFGHLEKFLFFCLIVFYLPRLVSEKYSPVLVNCGLLYLVVAFLFANVAFVMQRFAPIFSISCIITIAIIFSRVKYDFNFLFFMCIILILGFAKVYLTYSSPLYYYNNILIQFDSEFEREESRRLHYSERIL